jgi:hypothetical protein
MDFNELIDLLLEEGGVYLRNLAVPLTITLVIAFVGLRAIKNFELTKMRGTHRDQIINVILDISHTYLEFLDQFHIRSKYNPQLIETLSEKLGLEISNLGGLSAIYFSKKKQLTNLKEQLSELRSLYTLLVGKKEPFQVVSRTDYLKYQEEFSDVTTNMMKTVRNAKLI